MSELYTRIDANGNPNTEIEEWFSTKIEGPFRPILDQILTLPHLTTEPAPHNAEKKNLVNQLGFITNKSVDFIKLSNNEVHLLSKYIAALLVRTPTYLTKIANYHDTITPAEFSWGPFCRNDLITQIKLNQMLQALDAYYEVISKSDFIFIKTKCDKEFLYSDTGIVAQEPWNSGGIPFDIHAPLTPELAVNVLPAPNPVFRNKCPVAYLNSQGVSRMNRIIVGNAENFVWG